MRVLDGAFIVMDGVRGVATALTAAEMSSKSSRLRC